MLKLKSVVKNREQLLATGWELNPSGNYSNKEINDGVTVVNSEMLGGVYNGIIKDRISWCKLEGSNDSWVLYPEMVLLVDQWGFVRHSETLDILMWDGVCGEGVVKSIDHEDKFPIYIKGRHSDVYTKEGRFIPRITPTLSKYPYSLINGGYTLFDFEQLKEAFNCPKVYKTTESESENNKNIDELIKISNIVSQWKDEGYKYILIKSKI